MLRDSYAKVVQGVGSSRTVNHNTHNVCDDDEVYSRNDENPDVNLNLESQTNLQYNALAIDNNSHPLFIHNTDHPGLVLIAKKLVGPDNYAPWSRSMQIALNARDKFVIVNGTYAKPAENSPLYAQWEKVNDLIIT